MCLNKILACHMIAELTEPRISVNSNLYTFPQGRSLGNCRLRIQILYACFLSDANIDYTNSSRHNRVCLCTDDAVSHGK